MSAKLNKSKPIQDEFSPEQPGQINVAGEVFFLNLPGQEPTDITSSLYDDSVKGDLAFQVLFLGGLPIEEGGKNFTKQQQTDVRRIFRAIFGPSQNILPTKSQLLSFGRKAIGKKGVVIAPKESSFQLPCDDKDRDLMIKALEIRRTKLIEQIQGYDKLAINDIHGRYMRDHLKKLNDLLDNQINEARRTKKGCRFTGIIDPNASKPLALNDERMHRLLEIFAYLLAQGKDPLRALSGRYPIPSQVLPMMANADAPDIYEYEEAFGKERDGKTPEYPQTLLKLKKVLEGDAALGRAVEGEELKNIIKDAETMLFPTNPKRSDGTIAERKKRIIDHLRMKEDESKRSLAEISGLTMRLAAKEAELKKCTAAKEACEAKVGPLESGKERKELLEEKDKLNETIIQLGNELIDLKEKLAAEQKKASQELENLRGIQTLAVTKLRAELQEQRRKADDQAEELKKCESLPGELAAAKKEAADAKQELAALKAKSSEPSEEEAAAKAVLEGQVASLRRDLENLRGELAAKETELASLRTAAASAASSAGAPPDYAEKVAEIARLGGEITALEERVRTLTRDNVDANTTLAEKNLAIAAKEETIAELRASLAAAEARGVPADVERLRSEIIRLQADIANKGDFIENLLRSINAILGEAGATTTVELTDSSDAAGEKIRMLSRKFSQLQEEAARPRQAAPAAEGLGGAAAVCLLNIVYTLFKKLISKRGYDVATQETIWNRLFQEVNSKSAALRTDGGDDAILAMFELVLQNYRQLPSEGDGERYLQGVSREGGPQKISEAMYATHYSKMKSLLKKNVVFGTEVRNYASYLLRLLLGEQKDFTRYIFTESNRLENAEPNLDNIDIATIFLFVLSLTRKVIDVNEPTLTRMGCTAFPR